MSTIATKLYSSAFLLETLSSVVLCLSIASCSGKNASDFVDSLAVTPSGSTAGNATFAAPAFSFTPSLFDFGGKILNSSTSQIITIRNVSVQNLYVASITSPSVHYSVGSSTCPQSPAPFVPDATCQVTVQFGPKTAGSLGANLQIIFSSSLAPGSVSYSGSGTALLGTGLTTLNFAGLQAISGVTTTSMILSWTADPVASAYLVYQMQAGAMVYIKTVNNIGGTVSGTIMTGLTPSTPYSYRVRAIDSNGNSESNTLDVSSSTSVPGSFTTASLAVAEASTQSINLTSLCGDIYSTAPSSFRLVSETSTNGLPHCSVSGSTLQCSPDYKTGHAAWTETATVVCRLNESDLSQTFAINVADTNIPAALASIGNQTVLAGLSITNVDANGSSDTQVDSDSYIYSCFYDTTIDGAVASSTACSSLTGAGFNTSTGVLNWTTTFAQGAQTYEFRISANDGVTTASRIFTVQVDSAVPIITHSPPGNRVFPSTPLDQSATLNWDFVNSRTNSDSGMTYACVFDRIIDGTVAAGTACNLLAGIASFDTTTGILNWLPGVLSWGNYEFKITGSNSAGSASEIAMVNIRPGYTLTDANVLRTLKLDLDAQHSFFSTPNNNNSTSPFVWRDLSTAATDATLTNTSANVGSGWAGTGLAANAYRFVLDGVNDFLNLGTVLASTSNWMIHSWINFSASTAAGKIILTNADGSGNGFTLKQSSAAPGKIVLASEQPVSYSQIVLADTPALYWRLGSDSATNAVDATGNGYTGTYSGAAQTPGAVGAIPGDSDTAVTLAGGVISSTLALGTTVTVEAWAKTTSMASNPMLWATSGSLIDLWFGSSTLSMNTGDGANNPFCPLPASATDGNYHHYVTVISAASNNAKVYYDGVLCGTAAYRNPSGKIFQISYSGYGWNGSVDEVAVYNSELSSNQITTHYNRTCQSNLTLANNRWYQVTSASQNGLNRLYINGQLQCTLGSTLLPSSSNLNLGAAAGSNAWNGSVADLKVFSLGASSNPSSDASINFEATANQFRTTPVENIVTDSLVLHLDAANAREGTSSFGNGCATSDAKWFDLSPFHSDATLVNFDPTDCGNTSTGWQGVGSPSLPYTIRVNGSTQNAEGTIPPGVFAGDFTIESWFYRTSITDYPAIFSTNTNGSASWLSMNLGFIYNTNIVGMHKPNNGDSPAQLDLGADHLNQWLHVTLRRQGGTLFVDARKNGVHLSMNAAINWTINTAQTKYYIGRLWDNGNQRFSGFIPIVRVYTRKLSDAEVLQNCRAQDARFPGTTCE